MQYTNQSHLKAATTFSDLPDSSPLLVVLKCLKDNVKCGRLHKAFLRWFSEKQKKVMIFSYGFTELESKYFCWHFVTLIQELLKINSLSKKSVWNFTLWHCCSQIQRCSSYLLKSRGVHWYIGKAKDLMPTLFNANCLLLNGVTSTVRTVGHAIPYHTRKLNI